MEKYIEIVDVGGTPWFVPFKSILYLNIDNEFTHYICNHYIVLKNDVRILVTKKLYEVVLNKFKEYLENEK